mmetsp:Transcript_8252/g.24400  ORF Transcript_8252/g.24400 Transcript_8252/m.24400 type:complete len:364 (-) Transcript_8252:759-1850(-)
MKTMTHEEISHRNEERGSAFRFFSGVSKVGGSGSSFQSYGFDPVREIRMTTYTDHDGRTFIGSIQLLVDRDYSSKVFPSDVFGGKHHIHKFSFLVPKGDAIVRAYVRRGSVVHALRFITRQGVVSPWYGGEGGDLEFGYAGPNQELYGVRGYSGELLNEISFDWRFARIHGEDMIPPVFCECYNKMNCRGERSTTAGGHPFQFNAPEYQASSLIRDGDKLSLKTVREVRVSTSTDTNGRTFIESIQLAYDKADPSDVFGGKHRGTSACHVDRAAFRVPKKDAIVKAEIRCDDRNTNALRFTTRNGVVSPWYGGTGGDLKLFEAAWGQELSGIYGRAGVHLNKVRFEWAEKDFAHEAFRWIRRW